MIQAAVFDIDGTLIDSVEGHAAAWKAAFDEHGHMVSLEELRRQIGKGSDRLLPCFLTPKEVGRIGEAIDKRQGEVFKTRYLKDVRAFPGARALFERLKRDGVKRVLGSSGKPQDVEQAEIIANIEGLVDAMATADDVARSKPSPDIIKAALDKIAPVAPDKCVFIGDTPWDAEAAVRAGVIALGLSNPVFNDDELRSAGCRQVFRDLQHLLACIDEVEALA